MRLILVLLIALFSVGAYGQTKQAPKDYRQATIAARDGDFESAEKFYRAALAKLPADADASLRARITFNIGVSLYRMGHAKDAVPFYHKALEISGGKYARPLYALGMAQSELGEFSEAAASFEKYLQMKPRDGEGWFDLGLARYALGDLAAAKKAFENAYENGTVAASDALNNIGVVLASEGDMGGAVRAFEGALRESGNKNSVAQGNLEICRRGETVSLKIKYR